MTAPIRIAVVGCSAIAKRSVLPAIQKCADFKLQAVSSRSIEKARAAAQPYGCDACSYEEAVHREDVDAVYVSLPVGLHHAWGKKAANAGKHLLMEKTFTSTLKEAEEVIAVAGKRKIVCMEALTYVYHPLFGRVQELIRAGEIGEVRAIHAFFGFPHLAKTDIRYSFDLGGGALLDALIYPLSFALYTAGEDVRSIAAHVVQDKGHDVDSRGFVQMNWGRCTAQLTYGFGFMYRNHYTVWGEKAYLRADRVFSRPPDVKGDIEIVWQDRTDRVEVEPADQFQRMFEAFASKIQGADRSGLNEKNDILARMKIISSIREDHIGKHADKQKR